MSYHTLDVMNSDHGFTLLEIMIAIVIFAIIITTIFTSYSSLMSGNETADQGTAPYEMAKNCLNQMVVDLESIHLTLAPGYSPPVLGEPPELYRIVGDISDIQGVSFPILRFTSLAHLSFGGKTEEGIAEIIYYVQASDDGNYVLKRADNLYPYETFEKIPYPVYGRTQSPTNGILEARLASLEGGEACVTAGPGSQALFNLIFTIARPGDNVVTSLNIFGEGYKQAAT